MSFFAGFQPGEWKIFYGNALMLATSALYLLWWALVFWPDRQARPGFASTVLVLTLLAGAASLLELGLGIASSPALRGGLPALAIIALSILAYFALLLVTRGLFRRAVTSELLIMVLWAAVELLAVNALYGCGRFSAAQAVALASVVGAATLAGLVCYVLYYRLPPYAGFWDGAAPLLIDSAAMIALLLCQAAARPVG